MLGCSVGVSGMLLAAAASETAELAIRLVASLHDLTRTSEMTLGVVEVLVLGLAGSDPG